MFHKIPSALEIENEIKALEALRSKIPQVTAFGDSNLDAIDAEIHVLREQLTTDDVEEHHDTAVELEDEGGDFYSENTYEHAIYAADWLAGETEEKTISEGWSSLVGLAPITPLPFPPQDARAVAETLKTPFGKKILKDREAKKPKKSKGNR